MKHLINTIVVCGIIFLFITFLISYINSHQSKKLTNFKGENPHAKLILCNQEKELYELENYVKIVTLNNGQIAFIYDYSSLQEWLDRAEILARDLLYFEELNYIDIYLFDCDSEEGLFLSRIKNDHTQ